MVNRLQSASTATRAWHKPAPSSTSTQTSSSSSSHHDPSEAKRSELSLMDASLDHARCLNSRAGAIASEVRPLALRSLRARARAARSRVARALFRSHPLLSSLPHVPAPAQILRSVYDPSEKAVFPARLPC